MTRNTADSAGAERERSRAIRSSFVRRHCALDGATPLSWECNSSVTCDYSARTRIRLSAYVDIALLTEPHHSHGNAIISAACEYSARVWIRLSAVGAACL